MAAADDVLRAIVKAAKNADSVDADAIARMLPAVDDFITGYRARATGEGWQPIDRYLDLEAERGNTPFTNYEKYLDGDYEVTWVARTPKDAEKYSVSAGEIEDLMSGRLVMPPDAVRPVDLRGASLVATDDEGGYLFIRPRRPGSMRAL